MSENYCERHYNYQLSISSKCNHKLSTRDECCLVLDKVISPLSTSGVRRIVRTNSCESLTHEFLYLFQVFSTSPPFSPVFGQSRIVSDVFGCVQMNSKVFGRAFFARFWKVTNAFGRGWTISDPVGCVQISSNVFGRVLFAGFQKVSKAFGLTN